MNFPRNETTKGPILHLWHRDGNGKIYAMSVSYDAKATEAKWRKRWEESSLYTVNLQKSKDPYYCLVMFPYPSGAKLHVGHWYQYGPTDSFARFMRMRGKDMFFPMGFDAFGLPAENYAIKTGVPPATSTAENVRNMVEQFRRMGCMYDWSKALNTSEHEYYRWTQWLFLQMHKHGLAYRKRANVNFCPACQTVLAREQCQDGRCERCETEVIQKPLEQWFWQITKYADELLDGLKSLDWPEKTKSMQEHWIGRSEGAEIEFRIQDSESRITVFTTRPDTLFGAMYMVLAPEHSLVEKITPKSHMGAVCAYQEEVRKKTELERTDLNKIKTGVWTGVFAINPASGEEIPIWIADYVLLSYGTGAVMAVPAHDERDFDFAHSYNLPIRCVLKPERGDDDDFNVILEGKKCWTGGGKLINSDFLDGLDVETAKKRMVAWLEDKEIGRQKIQYRLRDWLVSRQRYWGAPIPMVYDSEGVPHPIPEKHLPWILPTDVEFKPTGESPLKHSKEFNERTEKIFGKGWTPEYDTMDTFVCSSFYYLRFLMENNVKKFVDPHMESQWMPVSCYIGGPEHACMHLIYARFVMKVLQDLSFVKHREPFKKLVHQGLITNKGAKMSKSKGNVVSPDEFVERYGSDVFRLYLMFMGPYTQGGDWSDTGIKGMERFVQRIWKLVSGTIGNKETQGNSQLEVALHRTIKKVTEDMENFHFNTAIASLMEFLNILEEEKSVSKGTAEVFVKLLAPLTPHLAEELWESLGGKGFLLNQKWPMHDPALLLSKTMIIVVQVNGKVRANVEVSADASKEDILAKARDHENVQIHLRGGMPENQVYVPGRLVNFVV